MGGMDDTDYDAFARARARGRRARASRAGDEPQRRVTRRRCDNILRYCRRAEAKVIIMVG